MPVLPKTRQKAYFLLFINSILWGFSAPIIKYGLRFTNSEVFLFYRFIIATIIFFPIFSLHKSSLPAKQKSSLNFKTVIVSLLGGPLTLLPLFYGLSMTTSIEASILDATSPIFIVMAGIFLLHETLTSKELKGFFITLIGTAFLIIDPLITNGHSISSLSFKGNVLIVFSNFIWALFLYLSKKFKSDSITVSFYSYLLSIPFFALLIAFQGGNFTLHPSAILPIIYMSIGSSVIAFWAYIEGQKLIEISEAAIFTYLRPLFALPLGLIWLQEPMSPLSVVSLILITSGVFFAESPQKKKVSS